MDTLEPLIIINVVYLSIYVFIYSDQYVDKRLKIINLASQSGADVPFSIAFPCSPLTRLHNTHTCSTLQREPMSCNLHLSGIIIIDNTVDFLSLIHILHSLNFHSRVDKGVRTQYITFL